MFNQADLSLPESFKNVVRLFPLPNVVLFPGVVQALHIFEPRYRTLMEDSLAEDQLITMAYVKPAWEQSSNADPEIADTVCIGKILSHSQLPDGRYNLFLVGTKRAQITQELDVETPYRMAQVQLVKDRNVGGADQMALRQQLVMEFRKLAALHDEWNHDALDQFLSDDLPLGQLIDMIGYASGAEPAEQQLLLENEEVGRRGYLVLEILRRKIREKKSFMKRPDFPPDFSLN
ncbi:MAG: LON peptidase substrate-binding domain-containing protein [Planctomycetota bacterium]